MRFLRCCGSWTGNFQFVLMKIGAPIFFFFLLFAALSPAQTPDWNAVTEAPQTVSAWSTTGVVRADNTTVRSGTESMRLEAPNSSMTVTVQGPGMLKFHWKLWADGGTGTCILANSSNGAAGTLQGRQDWQEISILLNPGSTSIQWLVNGGGQAKTSALWVDNLRVESLASVPLFEALDAVGVTVNATPPESWSGFATDAAPDGLDMALVSSETPGVLTLSMTGPGWLEYSASGREPLNWAPVRLFMQPGPQSFEVSAFAVDKVRFSPLATVPIEQAADYAGPFPGAWGNGFGFATQTAGVTGGSAVAPSSTTLSLAGPGILRFSTLGTVQFSIQSVIQLLPAAPGWITHEFRIPQGGLGFAHVKWDSAGDGSALLDNVRFTPVSAVPVETLLETTLQVQDSGAMFPGGPAESHDGVDCALLDKRRLTVNLTGPGRVSAWIMDGQVSMGGMTLTTPAADASRWHFFTLDLPSSDQILTVTAARMDELSFSPSTLLGQPGNTAQAGYLSQGMPTMTQEGGLPVLVSGTPCSGTLILKASLLTTLNAGIFISTGVQTGFPASTLTPGGWTGSSLTPGAWTDISTTSQSISFSGPANGVWKLRAPSFTTPAAGALSIAEALDSPLEWTAGTTTGWTTYSKEPRVGVDDVVLLYSNSARVSAMVPGPATVQIRYAGDLQMKVGSAAVTSVRQTLFIPSPQLIEFRGMAWPAQPGVLAAVTVIPSQWTTLPEIECQNVTAELGLLRQRLTGAAAWDGVDALNADVRVLNGAEGFLSWQQKVNSIWIPRIRSVAAGTITQLSGILDNVRLQPRTTVPLADAAEFSDLAFTVTPAGSWSGYSGDELGWADGAAISTTSLVSTNPLATLELSLPSAGILTWWRRREPNATFDQPAGTVYTSSDDWHFCYLPVTSAQTVRWATGLPSGFAWLDRMAWLPGAALPGPDAGLDTPGRVFSRSSSTTWLTAPISGATGSSALFARYGQWIQTSVAGPARVSIAAMTGNEVNAVLNTLVDGIQVRSDPLNGTGGWQRSEVVVGAGTHTVRWLTGSTEITYFLDDLRIEPIGAVMSPAEVADALDATGSGIVFSSTGLPLPASPADSRDGADAVRLAHSTGAGLSTSIPRGHRLRFWWRMPLHEAKPASACFSVDGVEAAAIHRGTGWREVVWDLPGTGVASVEWRPDAGELFIDSLSLEPLAAPTQSPASAAGWSDAAWLGNPSAGGAGWETASALSADGAAAISAGPAVLDLIVSGPGWLHFDYAAAGVDVSVDGQPRIQLRQAGPVVEYAQLPQPWRGFRKDAVEIPPGQHTVRLSADGFMILDRLRLLAALEPGLLSWQASPGLGKEPAAGTHVTITAGNPGGVFSVRAAGPGTLRLKSTVSAGGTHSVSLDGVLLEGALAADLAVDLKPGMHLLEIGATSTVISTTELSLSPGVLQLATPRQSAPELGWYEGTWSHAIIPPLSIVSWTGDTGQGSVSSVVRSVTSLDGRQHLFLDRSVPAGMRFGPLAKLVQVQPVALTTPELAAEALPGWSFTMPSDGSWQGVTGGGNVLGAFHEGDALVSTRGNAMSSTGVRASVSGPVNASFVWSAPAGLPDYGNGTLSTRGGSILTYSRQPRLSTRSAAERCVLQAPAGIHEFRWTSAGSLAVDHFTPHTGPLIGDIVEAPDLVWALASPTGNVADHAEIAGTEDVLRIGGESAGDVPSSIGFTFQGPALVWCRIKVAGTVKIAPSTPGLSVFSITSSGWRDLLIPVLEPGAGAIRIEPEAGSTLWLDRVTLEPRAPLMPAASLAEAVDAAHLVWEWSPGWVADNAIVSSRDQTGYARLPVENAGATATVRVQGAGSLSFRHAGSFRISEGDTTLLTTSIGGVTTVTLGTAGEHVIVFTYDSPNAALLDAVTWTPAGTVPDAAAAHADTDQDGVPSLLEYASGLDPALADARVLTQGTSSGLPAVTAVQTPAGPVLRMEYLERAGLVCVPEFASYPSGPWTPVLSYAPELLDSTAGWCRKAVQDPAPSAAGSRFCRLRVVVAP